LCVSPQGRGLIWWQPFNAANKSSGGGFLNLGIGSLRLAMADICEMTFQKQKDRLAAVSPKSDLTGL
jgi:hypothetical protein